MLLIVLRLEIGQDIVKDIKDRLIIESDGKAVVSRAEAAKLKKNFDYFYFSRLEFLRDKGHLKDRSPMKDFNLKHWRMVHK